MEEQEILYKGRRIQILRGKGPQTFPIADYPLTIWDKKTKTPWGNAKQNSSGAYEGFIQYGMGELSISGETLRELAADAYFQILWCEKNDV
jgi:hypothetical protein